ncbi:MAG: LOG family protein [Anaerolineaceae bacterium]|nr:LOG family protein [Anaerolineaceae bacterium]
MKITVFGGASTQAGEQLYEDAQNLGKLLGEAGYDVVTGGYIGTMEAVSRGAAEAGSHVIGVTCRDIESWRSVKANAWVKQEIKFDTLNQRLNKLIDICDGAIALPGGIGTLVEISLTWNQMVIHAFEPKPLILIGEGWKATIDSFFESQDAYINTPYRQYINFAPDIESAVSMLNQMFEVQHK